VVRHHLAVVPGTRALAAVQLVDQRSQAGIGGEQGIEDCRHFGQHAFGQVARVGAWIGRRLVRFVQRLGDVQRLLHIEAELARTHFLQGAQVERQRSGFPHALGLDRHHQGFAIGADTIGCVLRHRLLEAASGRIGGAVGRQPMGAEGVAWLSQQDLDRPVRHGYEPGDLAVAVDHQAQRGGLYPTDRQHT